MRFWITKNSELPVREQLVRQVLLGILSEDLPAGHKLPSVRALARRHHIHANTVSAAYHDLMQQGWLELRRGSGLYVRPMQSSGDGNPGTADELGRLLTETLQAARARGHEPEEVLHRLGRMLRPAAYRRILIAEPDPAMRRILEAEIQEHVRTPVEAVDLANLGALGGSETLVVALSTRAAKVRASLPKGAFCVALRLRSVRGSLEQQTMPGPDMLISIVSQSPEIRYGARAMLLAVGLAPESLHEVDSGVEGWRGRLGTGAVIVTDVLTARELPANCLAKVFRVIADASIQELKQLCGPAESAP
jgi:DNA-binding transcriptional regulator YhcF (GntR family)